MKIKKEIINYISLIALMLVSFSCGDDFVDVKPESENSENFFNTSQDYERALLAAYDPLQSTYLM